MKCFYSNNTKKHSLSVYTIQVLQWLLKMQIIYFILILKWMISAICSSTVSIKHY